MSDTEPRDPAKGAMFAECISKLTLQDLVDLVCLKATMTGAEVRIKITYPHNRKKAARRGAK